MGISGGQFDRMCPIADATLRSLRSRHISVIFLEIADTLVHLQVDLVWNDRGWDEFEDFLCLLAEERVDDGEQLVLELGVWRDPQLETCGPLNPGMILPRFRKKGSIRFVAPPKDPASSLVLDVECFDWGRYVGF